jgi:hypothetical protein
VTHSLQPSIAMAILLSILIGIALAGTFTSIFHHLIACLFICITEIWKVKSSPAKPKRPEEEPSALPPPEDGPAPVPVPLLIDRMGNLVLSIQSLFEQLSSESGVLHRNKITGKCSDS